MLLKQCKTLTPKRHFDYSMIDIFNDNDKNAINDIMISRIGDASDVIDVQKLFVISIYGTDKNIFFILSIKPNNQIYENHAVAI